MIAPLLDGLDEVAGEQRANCVEAINTWLKDLSLAPVAICCRLREYVDLPAPLDLRGAVAVEPLQRDDVEEYLDKGGFKLLNVRKALEDDPELWDLMDTPLPLTLLFLTQGNTGDEARYEGDPPRQRLYRRFVDTTFKKRKSLHGKEKTLRWLGWLATRLVDRNQTTFALEDLDFSWMPSRRDESAASLIAGLFGGLGVGLAGWLFFGLYFGWYFGLLFGLGVGLVGGLADRLFLLFRLVDVGGLRVRMVGGLIGGLASALGGGLGAGLGAGLGIGGGRGKELL
jgi:hypothetical protein